jgi:hypothetical protein
MAAAGVRGLMGDPGISLAPASIGAAGEHTGAGCVLGPPGITSGAGLGLADVVAAIELIALINRLAEAVVGARNQPEEMADLLHVVASVKGDAAARAQIDVLSGMIEGLGRGKPRATVSVEEQRAPFSHRSTLPVVRVNLGCMVT